MPNLSFLPGGSTPKHPSLLLRSEGMTAVIGALKERFDYVVLDLPAVLFSSDSVVLTPLCDSLLWVVRAGVTPIPTVRRAINMVEHDKIVGLALNDARLATPGPLLRLMGI